MKTAYNKPDMFHDEAAHKIERRLAVFFAVPVVILALYVFLYHFARAAF